MDLLAIAAADPTVLPLWAAFLFAFGMYPVGMFFGCNSCCDPCVCSSGRLPETITVSFSGFSDEQVQGPDLISLSFASSFGFMPEEATARVTSPGGDPDADKGPISAVEVTNGGIGYALIARVAPTVTAAPTGGGSGAEITVNLEQITHEGRPAWQIGSLSVADGGSGYPESGSITITTATGDTTALNAVASYACQRVEPTVSLSVNGTGSGASLTPTLSSYEDLTFGTFWYVSSVTVDDGGSGYTAGDPVQFTIDDGTNGGVGLPFSMSVEVDQDGAVTAVVVDEPTFGNPYLNRGFAYKNSGIIASASVDESNRGIYYREDPTIPGEKATVTVTANQLGPTSETAAGAVFSVVIDDDASSPTFGQITAVNIDNGGDNYLAWQYRPAACCADYWNGRSFVLQRISGSCSYRHVVCGTDCGVPVTVEYRGPSVPPLVSVGGQVLWYEPDFVSGPGSCEKTLESSSLITDCSDFSFTATNEEGATATVTHGGNYDPEDQSDNGTGRCHTCCRGDSDPPEEIEVEVADGYHTELTYNNVPTGPIEWFAPQYAGTFGLANPSLPLPIVVLRREWGMPPPQSGSVGCIAAWSGSLPVPDERPDFPDAGVTGSYLLSVSVGPCSNPLVTDCDHCWKKCETTAGVATFYSCTGFAGTQGSSESCLNCIDSPMCGPVAGEYLVSENIFGGPWCGIPGGTRVRVL